MSPFQGLLCRIGPLPQGVALGCRMPAFQAAQTLVAPALSSFRLVALMPAQSATCTVFPFPLFTPKQLFPKATVLPKMLFLKLDAQQGRVLLGPVDVAVARCARHNLPSDRDLHRVGRGEIANAEDISQPDAVKPADQLGSNCIVLLEKFEVAGSLNRMSRVSS